MGSIKIFLSRKNRKGKGHHMLNKNSIKTILNVKHTCIYKVTMLADTSIMIEVHATKGEQCRCGICGKKSKFYDNGNEGARTWRACDWAGHKVILVGPSCRVNCKEHGVVTCRFPWARHGSRFTRKFEELTAWMAVNCSRVAVAAFMRISWNTVGPIIERVEKDLAINPNARFDNLVRIGVDETSYRKGHKYITTVVNHDTGNVIWVARGHGKTIFEQFFKLLTPEQRNSIQLVSGDGAKWIDECIKEYCPNANRCVDPFHVIEWAMDALDSVRVDAWREAKAATKEQPKAKRGRPRKGTPSKDTTATELKNSKIALGKAPSNLTPNQQAKVEWIAKTDPRLYRAYKLKEALRLIFYNDTVENAKEALDAWFKWARHCRIPAFVELQKKINRHKQSILNTIEYGLTNARIEAINNKIKLSIRMAYGFRNLDNMMAMIMLRCSDIKVQLPWEKDEWSSFFCLG